MDVSGCEWIVVHMRVYEWIPSKYQIMPTVQRSHRPWSHTNLLIYSCGLAVQR